MSDWISVKDKLPQTEETFLVYCGGEKEGRNWDEIRFADFYPNTSYWNIYEYGDYDEGPPFDSITHWMTLPPPPEKEKK